MSMYAKYYDKLNNNYDHWIPFIKSQIPLEFAYGNMIEFGCGTGNILELFKKEYKVHGVDLSSAMLKYAKDKLPEAEFYKQNMVHFDSNKKFQIALCLFDSINHILDFYDWKIFFTNVSRILDKNGVFIIDANTTERLGLISERPALFTEFENNYFYMKLNRKSATNFVFDVRVLKRVDSTILEEEREEIEETTMSGAEIYKALKESFSKVRVFNEKKEEINYEAFEENEKYRLFFSCIK